jgi:3-oxoacyl-[acyl-carrier protein] reductase
VSIAPSRNGTAVVTGAAGALGGAIVERLLERGWRVVGIDRATITPQDHWTTETFRAVVADLGAADGPTAAIAEAKAAFGTIDLLVNAVGQIHSEPVLRFQAGRLVPHPRESWAQAIEANLTAPFLVAAAAAAVMVRQPRRGVIVNITSVSARGNEGQAAYAAAKAGLEATTKVMARELGPLGVRINAIAPGFIDTPSSHVALPQERLDKLAQATPLRRLGQANDVADAVEFCWTNAFLTGAIIPVDGGIVI